MTMMMMRMMKAKANMPRPRPAKFVLEFEASPQGPQYWTPSYSHIEEHITLTILIANVNSALFCIIFFTEFGNFKGVLRKSG